MSEEERVLRLEHGMVKLTDRLRSVENALGAAVREQPVRASWLPPYSPERPSTGLGAAAGTGAVGPPGRSSAARFEDVVGGRLLAWVGGAALLAGLAFFLALAISRGWIDEAGRTALAAAGSLGMLLLGAWLRERRRGGDVGAVIAATGGGGLLLTIAVACEVYELVPATVGLVGALVVGTGLTVLAVRWDAQVVGWLGVVGALCGGLLAGVGASESSLALLWLTAAAAAAIVIWRGWHWLGLVAYLVAAVQWAPWVLAPASPGGTVLVLLGFGPLAIAMALGVELVGRRCDGAVELLAGINVCLLSGFGWGALREAGAPEAAIAWMAGVGLVSLGIGVWGRRLRLSRVHDVAGAGVLALLPLLEFESVEPVVVVWSAMALLLAAWAVRVDDFVAAVAACVGAGAACMLAVAVTAPPSGLVTGVDDVAGLLVLAAAALACLGAGRALMRWVSGSEQWWRGIASGVLLYGVSVGLVSAFEPAVDLDTQGRLIEGLTAGQDAQVALSALWAAVGLVALVAGLKLDIRAIRLGALGLLAVTIVKVFAFDLAALSALYRVASLFALGGLLLAGAYAYSRKRPRDGVTRG